MFASKCAVNVLMEKEINKKMIPKSFMMWIISEES
jgi:hypothetical protein